MNWNARARPELIAATYKRCAWCGKPIDRGFDRHHWLIKRGNLPKNMYPLIDVVINVVPVHHHCHMAYGSTKTFKNKCYAYVSEVFGEELILQWYNSISVETHL